MQKSKDTLRHKGKRQDVPFAGVLADVEERGEGTGCVLAQWHAEDLVALDLH